MPDSDSHIPVLLDWFLSSGLNICSTGALLPLENSEHIVDSVLIDFFLNSKRDAPFHQTAYFRADRNGLCDYLKDILWENIFKLGASVVAAKFCEWVQVGIDI